jgi:glycogen phosphorylase/synthase
VTERAAHEPPASPAALCDVSWEVCHKVGGVHAVLAGRARKLVERFGDAYVAVGPWLLSEGNAEKVLDPDPAFDAFAEGCRAAGVPVRVGRWRIDARPRTILVEFSGLYARKDEILENLWKRHQVDSLFGAWDYVEPVLFGHAAGVVVRRWFGEFGKGPLVAQFHEWLAGAGLLELAATPEIGTVFTVHGSVLGRSLAGEGKEPAAGLAGRTPLEAADALGIRGKHTLEAACARRADVLTCVSETAADELERWHGRRADLVLPNGIDAAALLAAADSVSPETVHAQLVRVASRFTGSDVEAARFVCTAGRYEFATKGFDVLLAAAAKLAAAPGPRIVLFLFVPAPNTGVRRDLAERLRADAPPSDPLGVSTHQLAAGDEDPIVRRCAELGLANQAQSRVLVVFVPAYLDGHDGLLDVRYESVIRAADLTVFPSLYDAWGCTPQESLALGVPSVTSDGAGFGRWVQAEELGPTDGVRVLERLGRTPEEAAASLAQLIEDALAAPKTPELSERCREVARRTGWDDVLPLHLDAFARAAAIAAARPASARTAQRAVRPSPERGRRPTVFPLECENALPPSLAPLERLAWNWRFTWDAATAALFCDLSPSTWERVRGNPLRLLREAPPADLTARAADGAFVARVAAAAEDLARYLDAAPRRERPIAYVCAEYGLAECLPIYSGGLGVLAGDHLRAASDLGLPLVAVGILYRKGYMRQRLRAGVEQLSLTDEFDPRRLPLVPVLDAAGSPLEVELHLPGSTLRLRAFRADVGRVQLYLLDADFEANRAEERALTHSLYGGDVEHRVRQEIVLGRGGARLLAALGIDPAVWHVNEGHGAFVVVERTWQLVRDANLTFDEAREIVRASTVFTTHTPVPAGHDVFDEDLMRRHYSHTPERLGLSWERFFALGASPDEPGFNMTHLALRFSGFVNGVSRRHGDVSRGLLRGMWPHLAVEEVPIGSVTNGVHLAAWTHGDVARLLGAEDREATASDFARAESVDAAALWTVRSALRRRLLDGIASHLRAAFADRNDSPGLLARTLEGLAEEALWIGFARRFATYKRADLVFSDAGRLRALLDAPGRPVRLVVAGKAHPKDHAAKELLAKVARTARTDEFVGRVIVLENYDLELARRLVQGVDVWLNTPRPPLEASGTSGMKAAANGALNLSVGDGWWLEGFDGTNGWRIGRESVAADEGVQDEEDAADLHRLLEDEVVPLFFLRDAQDVPAEWLARVRRSLATIPPVFDAARMVAEYRDRAYTPLARRGDELRRDAGAAARVLAAAHARIASGMAAARVVAVGVAESVVAGAPHAVEADVDLGPLTAEEVVVEFVVGRRSGADLRDVRVVELAPEPVADGPRRFTGAFCPEAPGPFGSFVRVRPRSAIGLHDPAIWA